VVLHVPVRDFNANEVRDFLKKSTSAINLSDQLVRGAIGLLCKLAHALERSFANHLTEYLESTAGTPPDRCTRKTDTR
jgi:hypothetical protein